MPKKITFLALAAIVILIILSGIPGRQDRAQAGKEAKLGLTPIPIPTIQLPPVGFGNARQSNTRIHIPLVGKYFEFDFAISYYMKTVNFYELWDLGCQQADRHNLVDGTQIGIVFLDFGPPARLGGDYGTYLFSNGFVSTEEIGQAALAYTWGYTYCHEDSSRVVIGVGTNNYYTGEVTPAHGVAWGKMINNINQRLIDEGLWHTVITNGASDMEMGFNGPQETRAWVDAYDSVTNWNLLNFGDAAGCPPYGNCGTTRFPDWTQEDVWYISYGAGSAYPLPEIYTNSGTLTNQWYRLSLFGYEHTGLSMRILGTLTQYGACRTRTCHPDSDNSPYMGFTQLQDRLNADYRTAQELHYASDIRWLWEEPIR